MNTLIHRLLAAVTVTIVLAAPYAGTVPDAGADETCMSPYMAKITGQEDFVYVWTLGVEGLGDGQDKLVTIDARPDSPTYGKVLHTVPVIPARRR